MNFQKKVILAHFLRKFSLNFPPPLDHKHFPQRSQIDSIPLITSWIKFFKSLEQALASSSGTENL